ncbi:hypothetical protein HDU83_005021 [Entophlyctis luteolus]|nr:hypothetical protein HDU83_005021 [Entophlyctis luteolus]
MHPDPPPVALRPADTSFVRVEPPMGLVDADAARRPKQPAPPRPRASVEAGADADADAAAAASALYGASVRVANIPNSTWPSAPQTSVSAASSPTPSHHDRDAGSHLSTVSLPSPVAPNLDTACRLSGVSLLLKAGNLSTTNLAFNPSASLPAISNLLQKQQEDQDNSIQRKRATLPQLPTQQYQLRQHRHSSSDGYFQGDDEFVNEPSPSKRKRAHQQKPAAPTTVTSSREKSYPCLYPGCGKVFPRAYNLKSHSYCHSGERPHSCATCGASFSRKHDLQRHVRTLHAKEPPRICIPCKQSFASIEQFQRHVNDAHDTPAPETEDAVKSDAATHVVLGASFGAQSAAVRPHINYDRRPTTEPSFQNDLHENQYHSTRHKDWPTSAQSVSYTISAIRRDGIGVLAEAAEVEMRRQQMMDLKVQHKSEDDDFDDDDDDDGDVDDADDDDYDEATKTGIDGRPGIFVKKSSD